MKNKRKMKATPSEPRMRKECVEIINIETGNKEYAYLELSREKPPMTIQEVENFNVETQKHEMMIIIMGVNDG